MFKNDVLTRDWDFVYQSFSGDIFFVDGMGDTTDESILESLAPEVPMFWSRGSKIGRGSFGDVFLVKDRDRPTDVRFIVKDVQVSTAKKDRHKNITELEVYKYLYHRRIVAFHGFIQHNDTLSIFMTYMPKGTLAQYINVNDVLNEDKIRTFTRQILEGVSYLHTRKIPIIHRDIKAQNVLLEDDINIRLADFGVSKMLKDNTQARTCTGTYNWMAPEVIEASQDKPYCLKADIWSVGCTVIEMATKEPPFPKLSNLEIIRAVSGGARPDYNLPEIPQVLKSFLGKTFAETASERPSAEELLLDDFMTESQISNKIPNDRDRGELIGEGSFGRVYLVRDLERPREDRIAVKEIDIDAGKRETIMDLFRKEANTLMNINHERIVPFYGYFQSRNVLSVYMGNMKKGSLADYILKNNQKLGEDKVKLFCRQILEGVQHLHEQGIIHKDITSKHVLVENENSVKLGCISVSKTLRAHSSTKAMLILDSIAGCVSSANWMAPETVNGIVENKQLDHKADIWSVGCVVVEMVTGSPPTLALKSSLYTLKLKEVPLAYSLPESSPQSLRIFLNKTFEFDPRHRPDAKELLDDDIFCQRMQPL
ncbi:unnamed protein product [Lymnaea stagnalis]|uniref:Protein kinase domain-containing protein n=1 Tax=Lymnaea stagnalis TaxID=6523 RepID=A0AAV2HRA0_LYMST